MKKIVAQTNQQIQQQPKPVTRTHAPQLNIHTYTDRWKKNSVANVASRAKHYLSLSNYTLFHKSYHSTSILFLFNKITFISTIFLTYLFSFLFSPILFSSLLTTKQPFKIYKSYP